MGAARSTAPNDHAPVGDREEASPRPPRPDAWSSDGRLRVEVVTDLDDLEALAERWTALVHTSPDATAYASPAYLLTWYRRFERPGGVYALTVWDGDRLVGLAPFARTRLGGGPAGASLLVSAGTEHGDYGDPLLGPDPGPVADAIADHLAALVRRRTVVNVRRLRDGGPMLAAIERHDELGRTPMGQVARAAVVRFDVVDDAATHLRRLGRKHGVPRRMRRLAEAHGEVAYQPAEPDLTAALDAMRDMLARRWGPGAGPRLFHSPGLEAFTRDVTRALVASGFGRVAVLRSGDRPVAVSTILAVGDRIVSDNAAFDPELAPFGPGQAEMHMMLSHAWETGVVEVDLRAGDFPYKYRWANASHTTRSLALSAPGRRGEAMLRARRALMSLRARRLGRLCHEVQGDGGSSRRRWVLAIAVVVGVASGAGDPTLADAAVAPLVAA